MLHFDQRGLRKPEAFPVLLSVPLSVVATPYTQVKANRAPLLAQAAGALLVLRTSKADLDLYQHRVT